MSTARSLQRYLPVTSTCNRITMHNTLPTLMNVDLDSNEARYPNASSQLRSRIVLSDRLFGAAHSTAHMSCGALTAPAVNSQLKVKFRLRARSDTAYNFTCSLSPLASPAL